MLRIFSRQIRSAGPEGLLREADCEHDHAQEHHEHCCVCGHLLGQLLETGSYSLLISARQSHHRHSWMEGSQEGQLLSFSWSDRLSLFAGPSRPSDRIAGGGSAGSWRLAPQFLFGGFLRRSARLLGSILAVPQSCLSSQEACSSSSSQMSSLPTSLSSYNSSLIRQTGKFISSILSLPLNWIEPCQSNAFVQLFCIALSFSYLIIICSRMSRNRLVSFSFFLFQKCYSNLFL